MNIVFFDPSFLKPDKLPEIISRLKIKEVYNLLPYNVLSTKLSSFAGDKLAISRRYNEPLDQAKKRCVYKLVSHISTPIVVNGEWIGDCSVADIYSDSRSNSFKENLLLEHPNSLILLCGKFSSPEESNIRIMSYFFNILKKYSKIKYEDRICRSILSCVITTDYRNPVCLCGFDTQGAIVKAIASGFYFSTYQDIASHFLTEEGILLRNKLVEEREKEDRENWQAQDDFDPDPWGANSEMEYIRNNGGDWIDD